MQIGLSVEKYKGVEPSVLLALAKRFGLEHVEITKSVFEDLLQVKKQINGLSSGFHLPVIEVDGFDFSCIEKKDKIEEVISHLNANWRDLGIAYCVTHPPEPEAVKSAIQTSTSFLLKNLARLEPPLVLENVSTWKKGEFEVFYQKAKEMLGKKLYGICFDVAHCYLSGEDIEGWFKELCTEVRCIHISDCLPGEDLHLPFDSGGVLPIKDFLSLLVKMRFKGTINLELQPKSILDLQPVLNSYLKVLRHFKKGKYWKTKARLMLFTPMIRMLIS